MVYILKGFMEKNGRDKTTTNSEFLRNGDDDKKVGKAPDKAHSGFLGRLARKAVVASVSFVLIPLSAQVREVLVPVQDSNNMPYIEVIKDGVNTKNPIPTPPIATTQPGGTITSIIFNNANNLVYIGMKNIHPTIGPYGVDPTGTVTAGVFSLAPQSLNFQSGWASDVPDSMAITQNGEALCTGTLVAPDSASESSWVYMLNLKNNGFYGFTQIANGTTSIGTGPQTCWNADKDMTAGGIGVTAIYLATVPVVAAVPVPINMNAAYISITPDGSKAYLSTMGSSVTVMDASTYKTDTMISLQGNSATYPGKVVFSSDGSTAYVGTGALQSSDIESISGPTLSIEVPKRGPEPNRRTFSFTTQLVSAINIATNAVEATIPTGGTSTTSPSLALTPDGTALYAVVTDRDTILAAIINLADNSVTRINIARLQPGTQLTDTPITFSQDGAKAYYALGSNLYIIDTASRTVTSVAVNGTAIGPIAAVTVQ
jgi:hypothetical protein